MYCKFFENNFHDFLKFCFTHTTIFSISSALLLLQSKRMQVHAWAFVYHAKNLIRSFFTRLYRAIKIRSVHFWNYHSIRAFGDEHRIAWRKNVRMYNMWVYSFLLVNDFSFYYLLMADIPWRRLRYLRAIGHAIVQGYRIPVGVISRRRVRSIFGG